MFRSVKSSYGRCIVGVLLLAMLTGCGTSQYNSLVKRRVASLRGEVKFQGLYAPSPIPGTPYSVRIPIIYAQSFEESSGHPDDGDRIRPDRLQPPFLPLRGLKLCYESTATSGSEKLPYYCYLAVAPAQPGEADRMASQIQARLKEQFPDAPDEWDRVDADSPSGFALHWRKIRVTGDQPFLVKSGGEVAERSMPGVFELWLHDADDYVVLIGWRAPTAIEGPSPDIEPTILGGVLVPPTDAKPDFEKWPILTAGTLTDADAP